MSRIILPRRVFLFTVKFLGRRKAVALYAPRGGAYHEIKMKSDKEIYLNIQVK